MIQISDKLVTQLYVSPKGNDSGSDGSINSPFSTLKQAQDAVRKLDKSALNGIEILLREGIYYLQETFELTHEDSGTEQCPITYAAYECEQVTLSGARRVDAKWEPYQNGLWKCTLPSGLSDDFGQLFINGQRQILARYPNKDDAIPGKSGYITAQGATDANTPRLFTDADRDMAYPGAPPEGIIYDASTFTAKQWKKPEEAVIHIFQSHYWGNLQFKLIGRDDTNKALWFGEGGAQIGAKWHETPCMVDARSRYFVENVFEELDAPGEWYYDKDTRTLYYMPQKDTDMLTAVTELSALKCLVRLKGRNRRPVEHISFCGLRFAHTEKTFFDEYDIPSLGDWAICRCGSVYMEHTRHCGIEKCDFNGLGGNAVFLSSYNRSAIITGNRFSEIGESAVCLVGIQNMTVGSQRYFPYECTVSHNIIRDCGVFGKQTAGVFISVAKRITAEHNLIHHMPRAGICINDGTWGGHVIAYNRIFDTCRETGDHGPFNAWGRDRFWCLLHSHWPKNGEPVCHSAGDIFVDQMETVVMHHNYFSENQGWGLDLDDGASNYHIYKNLCVGVSMKLREGAYRLIENNIWVRGANSPCFHVGNTYNHDKYLRNITVMDTANAKPENDLNFEMGAHNGEMYTLIKPPFTGPWLEEVDYNLFYSDVGSFSARAVTGEHDKGEKRKYTLEQWRELGFDTHSLFADPCFTDPQNDDYTLRPESPALSLGIESFDLKDVGPDERYRKLWQE